MALADSSSGEHAAEAERAAHRLADDGSASARRELAGALGRVRNARFHELLVPLMLDADERVAREAVSSVRRLRTAHPLFVLPLVSLTRGRAVRADARQALADLGPPIVPLLGHLLADRDEAIELRRQVPAALGRIPSPESVVLLVRALDEPDRELRFEAIAALARIRQHDPTLDFPQDAIEKQALRETARYFTYLGLHYNLFRGGADGGTLVARALADKSERARDSLFRLLTLRYSWKDIMSARWAIEHGSTRLRASATEFLDNLLSGTLRKRVLPMVEDVSLEERVRRGNVFLKSRVRDAEETLAQLIHDDDQILAAAAIHHVGRTEMALTDDVEYVLEHRDARDWFVFEAASWALAGHRLEPAARRARWMEPLPAVEIVDRLRVLPLFSRVSIADLFAIAAAGRQVRYERGRTIAEPSGAADALPFLLEGTIRVESVDGASLEGHPPAAPGLEDILAGRPWRATITSSQTTVCLLIDAAVFMSLVGANRQLTRGLFRALLDGRAARRSILPVKNSALVARARCRSVVDKAIALGAVPLFARVAADDLLGLGAIAREEPLAPGAPIIRAGGPASVVTVIAGALAVDDGSGAPQAAGCGDTLGLIETLCGETMTASATVTEPGTALVIEADDLFDVLAERVDLLQTIFASALEVSRYAAASAPPPSSASAAPRSA